MHNLEDVLFDATDEIHDASNLDIDDILNESDGSIKELNIEKVFHYIEMIRLIWYWAKKKMKSNLFNFILSKNMKVW